MTVSLRPGYKAWSAPAPTTGALAKLATGTGTKTLLQLATPATYGIYVEGWGFSYDTAVGGVGDVELLTTDVAATVTAHAASGLISYNRAGSVSNLSLGTALSGYNASGEGSITATKVFDAVSIGAATSMSWQAPHLIFESHLRPWVGPSSFLRIRFTAATSGTNALCWIKWHEVAI